MEKDEKTSPKISRRQFIGTSFSFAAGLAIGTKSALAAPALFNQPKQPDSMINGVQIGAITYSYRSMPNQSAKGLLKNVVNSGISAVELMGGPAERFAGKPESPVDKRQLYGLMKKAHNGELNSDKQKQLDDMKSQMKAYRDKVTEWRTSVAMDKFVELKKMYQDAGVSIYAWKPQTFGKDNTDAEIDYAFRVAKALGANSCTTEHPGNDAQTKRLGNIAADHKIYIAYHAHTQATPTLWNTALAQSKYNAINLDIGHYVAAGNPDPLKFIRAKHDRITSMHLKDRTTPAHGQKNLPWGQGDTPLVQALRLMRDQNYSFPGSIELEYKIPEGSDAVQEVSKCLDFCRKALNE